VQESERISEACGIQSEKLSAIKFGLVSAPEGPCRERNCSIDIKWGPANDYHFVPLHCRAVACVFKIKIGALGWLSGTISIVVGLFILATFLALFNYLTPSGRVTVAGRVVEVIPVRPNVPVRTNDVLFQIDPAPFQYKVTQLQASLAAAKQQIEILKSNYEQATANVTGLAEQVAFNAKRLERGRLEQRLSF
jgi:hypothetical protein